MGKWSVVLALVAGAMAYGAYAAFEDIDYTCDDFETPAQCEADDRHADRLEAIALQVFILGIGGFVAFAGCGVGYLVHLRRVRHASIVYAPRLQGWKNWLVERRIGRADYDRFAPIVESWMKGSGVMTARLGATYLRRLGYGAFLLAGLSALATWGAATSGGVGPLAVAVFATAPVVLVAAGLAIAAGIALGVRARRALAGQEREVEALEAQVLSAVGGGKERSR